MSSRMRTLSEQACSCMANQQPYSWEWCDSSSCGGIKFTSSLPAKCFGMLQWLSTVWGS
jgi:hypothetical protein